MQRSTSELDDFEARVGYVFRDRSLLDAALTHSSALPSGPVRSSEQLEFLGDAVLDLAIANLMLRAFPDQDEGQLSKWRALLVRTRTLAAKARQLGIGGALLLGRGEERSGGRSKDSILAAAYESVLGAIFRDGGFSRAEAVIARHFMAELAAGPNLGEHDWKTQLQELSQARFRSVPEYRLAEERGPPHARHFTTEVWVEGKCLARGDGSSKRDAEQQAARVALEQLAIASEPCRG
jgi:ribonuclease III